jgi:hypothetical protein
MFAPIRSGYWKDRLKIRSRWQIHGVAPQTLRHLNPVGPIPDNIRRSWRRPKALAGLA